MYPIHQRLNTLLLGLLLVPAVALADSVSFQRPGRMVDVGTHRMHIHCTGKGQPAVVLDAGLGGLSLEWLHVQQLLAGNVQVCTYDRSGYGWSEAGPMPRTSSRNADELYALLRQAHVPGPYVLVGHSYGGYNIRLFAGRYPQATAALVFVDASHPDQIARFRRPPINLELYPRHGSRLVAFSRPIAATSLPDAVKRTAAWLLQQPRTRVAAGSEYMNFETSAIEVQQAGSLPDVPVLVVTRGRRVFPQTRTGDHMEALWLQLQTELAATNVRSAHLVANHSGHQVHLDQPVLVSQVISRAIGAIDQCCHWSLQYTFWHRNTMAVPQSDFVRGTWLSDSLASVTRVNPQGLVWHSHLDRYESGIN